MLKFPLEFIAWLNAMQLSLALQETLDEIETMQFHLYLNSFYSEFERE